MNDFEQVERYRSAIVEFSLRTFEETGPTGHLQLAQMLLMIKKRHRWYQLTEARVTDIWDFLRIEENIRLFEYVMDGTTAMLLQAKQTGRITTDLALDAKDTTTLTGDQAWTNFVYHLAASLSWVHDDNEIDAELRERAPDTNWLKRTFTRSPWLVFLYLHSTIALRYLVPETLTVPVPEADVKKEKKAGED